MGESCEIEEGTGVRITRVFVRSPGSGIDGVDSRPRTPIMPTFDELAVSRIEWIDSVLKPWCRQASFKELLKAEQEWGDVAGRVDPEASLWTWAWSRFPDLVHEGMSGVNETNEVQVTLKDGTTIVGFPDARQSTRGRLVLLCRCESRQSEASGPHSIDDVASVARVSRA